jgi:hypothetical protein
VAVDPQSTPEQTSTTAQPAATRPLRLLALFVVLAGVVMLVGGAVTWFKVQGQLADERIHVASDSSRFAGDLVNGPFTAYQEAAVIERHALETSGGKTYAELDREDPKRQTVMTGSFLRASLYTSVVSFGVAAMAMGLGLVLVLVGFALILTARALEARTAT